ncbi:carbamoyl-phosphate synthase large subunit [Mucilaginibacter yixingensis]|uniref:Carbamoyl-phosphate synthase large subunit n=1 Tax=Mucilaginibacter yixingensis TaxID=1295612 RepID=A0A2T5JGM4_9SPHI|nr:ATP-grasp domain-containing protein [Mucilaginibacter yixingensis]PTR01593.1 carbamoyl-phosphate synthase large subunit [Mucilaginibacter yixingensis]
MSNILITSAGQRVSLVRAFKKELAKINPNAKVYTVDLNPILAPACHVADGYKNVPRVTEPGYITELLRICIEWGVKIIIPTIDTELVVLSENRHRFLDAGISVVISEAEFVRKCRDKRITNDFFLTNNIEVPKAIDKNKPSFPLFIKPYDGSLSADTFLIKSKDELTSYHYSNPKLMFMEYIDPNQFEEFTVDCFYDDIGYLKCSVPRKRIFVRSGEVSKGVTRKNIIVEYLKENLSYIEGARGCLTMQFFYNPSTHRLIGIEINPRFGGGYPLSYLAGANFPKWIIEEYVLGLSPTYFAEWETDLLMLRYDDEVIVHSYEI